MEDAKLGLAFAFEDAPKEIKTAAEKHKENYLAFMNAKKQLKLWAQELEMSKHVYMESAKEFDLVLKTWDPFAIKKIKKQVKE